MLAPFMISLEKGTFVKITHDPFRDMIIENAVMFLVADVIF